MWRAKSGHVCWAIRASDGATDRKWCSPGTNRFSCQALLAIVFDRLYTFSVILGWSMNSEIVFLEKFFPAATEKVRQSSLPTNHCLGIAPVASTPSRRYPYNNSSTLEDVTAIFVDSLLRSVHNVGNLLFNWTPTSSACVFQANGTDHAPHLWYHKSGRPRPNLPYLEFRLQGFLQQRYDTT